MRKSDRAGPAVKSRQADRKMREKDKNWRREQQKWLQRGEAETLDCSCLLCLAQWPSGGRDDGHMNQRLSVWKMAGKKEKRLRPALWHEREEERQAQTEKWKTRRGLQSRPTWQKEEIKTHHGGSGEERTTQGEKQHDGKEKKRERRELKRKEEVVFWVGAGVLIQFRVIKIDGTRRRKEKKDDGEKEQEGMTVTLSPEFRKFSFFFTSVTLCNFFKISYDIFICKVSHGIH